MADLICITCKDCGKNTVEAVIPGVPEPEICSSCWTINQGAQIKIYTFMRLMVGNNWQSSPLSHLNKTQIILMIRKWNDVFEDLNLPYRYILGGDGMIIQGISPENELAMKLFNSM